MMIPKLFHLPILVTVIVIGGKYKCKETYILLPKSLHYCQHRSQLRRLTITKQISLVFNGTSSLDGLMASNATSPPSSASILYICQVVIKPLGKSILLQYPTGIVQFWKLRYRLQLNLDCHSWLQMTLTYTDGVLDAESRDNEAGVSRRRRINNVSSSSSSSSSSAMSITNILHTYNCHNTGPVISNTNYRQITVSWDYSPANSDLSQLAVELDLSTYMRFSGNLTLYEKKRNCLLQNGFWCGDSVSTDMCINPQLRCDEADSCFDGGSDENECASILRTHNATFNELNRYIYSSIWTNLLPWIVVGLIFSMLAVALMLVCNQRRSDLHSDVDDDDDEVDEDDDEDNGDYNDGNVGRIDGRMIAGDDEENSLHKWQECINVCHHDTLCDAEAQDDQDIDYLHHCRSYTDKANDSDHIRHNSTTGTTTYKNYYPYHHRRTVVTIPGTGSTKSKHVETEDESIGFCIRYGGRIHRLNGDPCSPPPPQHHKVYVTSESTTSSVAESYLTNDLHQPTGSSVNNQWNTHYTNLDPSNNSTGNGEKVTPTESCSSNLNDEGVKSQLSVLTYCDISSEPAHNDEVCLQTIDQSIPLPVRSLPPLSIQHKQDPLTCLDVDKVDAKSSC